MVIEEGQQCGQLAGDPQSRECPLAQGALRDLSWPAVSTRPPDLWWCDRSSPVILFVGSHLSLRFSPRARPPAGRDVSGRRESGEPTGEKDFGRCVAGRPEARPEDVEVGAGPDGPEPGAGATTRAEEDVAFIGEPPDGAG
ncbi:hypothetical protein GCM10020358_47250 [Amorphoplanes nipponensis]|uniref:Uncharacterized protein n=1 Tax=Actinoplanes nipponensis TaxID=135950 RepID=A0A919JHK4_9ACTN|nr:hypothetical protein Ani05nite_29590 [Actinoplanes nipponensis]